MEKSESGNFILPPRRVEEEKYTESHLSGMTVQFTESIAEISHNILR